MRYLYIISILVISVLITTSCSTLNTAYVDDIYYNPKKEDRKQAQQESELAKLRKDNSLIQDTTAENFFFSDYNDYQYANRIEKFGNDSYEGDYYDEGVPNVNMGVGVGYSPYGTSWNVGFGYGYSAYYSPFYSPYYMPYYSWGYPYYGHYPPYGYYPPYYGCGYPPYYPSYPEGNINYGPRNSVATGSPRQANANIATRKIAEVQRGRTNSLNASQVGGASVNKSLDAVSSSGGTNQTVRTTRTASNIISNERGKSSSSSITKPRVSSYTRTRTAAVKDLITPKNRESYTPSYTRARTTSSRAVYNSSSRNGSSSNANNRQTIRQTNTPRNNTSKSTYTVEPSRSSGTNTQSNSTYSTPRSSGSSNSGGGRSNGSSGSSRSRR